MDSAIWQTIFFSFLLRSVLTFPKQDSSLCLWACHRYLWELLLQRPGKIEDRNNAWTHYRAKLYVNFPFCFMKQSPIRSHLSATQYPFWTSLVLFTFPTPNISLHPQLIPTHPNSSPQGSRLHGHRPQGRQRKSGACPHSRARCGLLGVRMRLESLIAGHHWMITEKMWKEMKRNENIIKIH